jgi:hypothetical protein
MTYQIVAAQGSSPRLEADERLRPRDFQSIAALLKQRPMRARKVGYVAARQAESCEIIETRWNGTETVNTARPGDWIVTSLSPGRVPLRDRRGSLNTYVIAAEKFAHRYEATGDRIEVGTVYRARGTVDALLFPAGFDIVAPWGEHQQAPAGYLILNGDEVYGNNAETFAASYEAIAS